jgi:hypothetical protein
MSRELEVAFVKLGVFADRYRGNDEADNRVNVAISRAQCLAVVVADPRVPATPPGSLDEMALINLFCKLSAPTPPA